MNKMNGIVKVSYSLGSKIIQGILLQVYFLLYSLRGGVVLGVFPALSAISAILYHTILDKEWKKISIVYKKYYQENFKLSNQLGYTFLLIGLILTLDLKVSTTYLKQPVIHFVLIFMMILILGTALFIFPSLSRYQLGYKNHIRQAFILFFSNLVESIAILLSFFIVIFLCVTFPILLIVAGIPLFMFPIVWFSIQAMKKSEEKVKDRYEKTK